MIFDPALLVLVLLVGTYLTGSLIERRHYARIRAREQELATLPAVTLRTVPPGWQVRESELLVANVVVSVDYFKRFLAGLRMLVGGRIASYETLLDRARREVRHAEIEHRLRILVAIGLLREEARAYRRTPLADWLLERHGAELAAPSFNWRRVLAAAGVEVEAPPKVEPPRAEIVRIICVGDQGERAALWRDFEGAVLSLFERNGRS